MLLNLVFDNNATIILKNKQTITNNFIKVLETFLTSLNSLNLVRRLLLLLDSD